VARLQLGCNRTELIGETALNDMSEVLHDELDFAGNGHSVVPEAVSSLKVLLLLGMSNNQIREVTTISHRGMQRLYALNQMNHQIGNISQSAFHYIPPVRIINLAQNLRQTKQQGMFNNVLGLQYLRVDSNAIENANGLFKNPHDLIMLNISANRIRCFDFAPILLVGLP
jgi:Leucine-rich repeat (LRR) protein